MEKKYLRGDQISIFCIMFFTVVAGLALYQEDSSFYNSLVSNTIRIIMYVLAAVMCVSVCHKLKRVNIGFFIPVLYWIYTIFNAYTNPTINLLNTITLILVFLVSFKAEIDILLIYRKWIILISILGIIGYSFYIFHVGFPYEVTHYYSNRIAANYIDYKFTYIFSSGMSLRLCGLFNEPGFFGTVLALLLCVDRLNPKHVGNWIMLIAGTMTFSAAFIIIISFYLVLNSIKSVKILILVIIALIFYFYVLPNMTFNNPNINTLVQRITWVNGGFFGDNRSNNIIDEAFIELWKTKYILFGHGGGYCASLITGGVASIKTYVIDYGIMGVLVIYGTLIAYSIRKCHNNWQALSYVFVFILSIYQRPNIYSPIYFILLLYGIDYINNNYVLEEKRRII